MPTDLLTWPDKDPADVADYAMVFEDLFPVDDPITAASWDIVPGGGINIDEQAIVDRSIVVRLAGGIPGATYRLTATATSAARVFQRGVTLFVREL